MCTFIEVISQAEWQVSLLHDSAKPHTSVRTTEAVTHFRRALMLHLPYSPDLAWYNYHLFGPLGGGCCGRPGKDTFMSVTRHFKMLCTSGCRGRRELAVTGMECMVFFRGGTRLSSEMETNWKTAVPSVMLYWSFQKFRDVWLVTSVK